MSNILVIRLSVIGDVAMTIPVIYSVAKSNPEDTFTVLTQAFLIPMFINRPANVKVMGLNTQASEKSFGGLLRFATILGKNKYDKIIDLQNDTRSFTLLFCSLLKATRIYRLDRESRKRKLIKDPNRKSFEPLRPAILRYEDVCRRAGLNYEESFASVYESKQPDLSKIHEIAGTKSGKWIGIAPFARYTEKVYPTDRMEEIVEQLAEHEDFRIFLFGARGYEGEVLDSWAYQYPRVINIVGKLNLEEELALISQLDVLVCMDSSNVHFASLVGTQVITIWGATHPDAGFTGYRQSPDNNIQLEMACRPCSVVGNKPCWKKERYCLQIPKETILGKILEVVSVKPEKK